MVSGIRSQAKEKDKKRRMREGETERMRKKERRRNRAKEIERERMTIRESPRWHLKSKSKKGICARVFIHFPLTFLVCPIPLGLSFAIQFASKKTEGRGRERKGV